MFGPGLVVAFQSGPGCAVPTYAIPVAGATVQLPPHPVPTPAKDLVPLKPKLPQSLFSILWTCDLGRLFRSTAVLSGASNIHALDMFATDLIDQGGSLPSCGGMMKVRQRSVGGVCVMSYPWKYPLPALVPSLPAFPMTNIPLRSSIAIQACPPAP